MEEITGGTGVFILSSEARGEKRLQGAPDNVADLIDFFENDMGAMVFKARCGIEFTRTKILEQILQFFMVPLKTHILYGMFHGFEDGSWKLVDGNPLTFHDVISCEAAKEAQRAHHLQIFVDVMVVPGCNPISGGRKTFLCKRRADLASSKHQSRWKVSLGTGHSEG